MARYAYDVNTTQRYIDVHKQFQGGLKTVDTDDALGAVFLREAENVSLSEFGFLEKRYGTYENFKIQNNVTNLQGYWEFKPGNTNYIIYAADGFFYVNGTKVELLYKENDEWRYPTTIFQESQENECVFVDTGSQNVTSPTSNPSQAQPTCQTGATYYSSCYPSNEDPAVWVCRVLEADAKTIYIPEFQTTRDINGVNVNNVMYFFTGTYPVYAKEVDGVLKFFLFSIDIPTYDEIVVVGHNILEFDYDEAYGFSGVFDRINVNENTSSGPIDYNQDFDFYINKSNYYPQFPYANEDGTINFQFAYNHSTYSPTGTPPYYFQLETKELSYATAGATASDVFTKAKLSNIQTNAINTNTSGADVLLEGAVEAISNVNLFDNYISLTTSLEQNQLYRFGFFLSNSLVTDYSFDADFKIYDRSDTDVRTELPITFINNQAYFSIPDSLGFPEDYQYDLIIEPTPGYTTNLYDAVKIHKFYQIKDEHNFGKALYNVELSDLLTGTWDFKFIFDIVRYDVARKSKRSVREVTYYIRDVSITPEKLQDFPGSENVPVKLHPIWSCNKVIEHFGKLMVWGSQEMKNSLFYSFPDRPTYFPQNFYLDFGNDYNAPIESVANFLNVLIVQTEDATWAVKGNSGLLDAPAPYTPFTVNPTVGTIAYKSVRPVRNKLFFLSKQGIVSLNSLYAVDEMYNVKFEDRNIYNIVPQDSKAVGIQFDNQYWLNFPNDRITLRWYIDKNAWVKDIFAWDSFKGVFKWQIVNGKLEFITYPSRFTENDNLAIYKVGIDYTLPTDLTGPITTRVETSFLNQNYPFHPKNYKEAKLDFTLQNEYNVSKETLYNEEEITITNGLHYLNNVSLVKNHRYYVYFYDMPETTGATITIYPTLQSEDGGYSPFYTTSVTPTSNYLEFIVPNAIADGVYDVKIQFNEGVTVGPLSLDLRDATYDNVLTFLTWIVSEDNTLNQDPIQDYDQAKAEIDFSLQDKFGDWEFGETNFGKTTTAVKTIKLSGKGYNVKLYMEDFSKSKWTLESLGLTYKMKRARSR